MRRSPAIVARLALTGTVTLTLGIAMLVAVLIEGSITPAFADTSPYELYCPGTPVGNVVINDVTTIGTLSPPSPSAEPFSLSGFQTQLTMPASVVSAFRAFRGHLHRGILDGSRESHRERGTAVCHRRPHGI